jgi:hypothetical protein
VHDLSKKQADREIAARTEEAQQKPVDVIEHMRKEADFQTARAVSNHEGGPGVAASSF